MLTRSKFRSQDLIKMAVTIKKFGSRGDPVPKICVPRAITINYVIMKDKMDPKIHKNRK